MARSYRFEPEKIAPADIDRDLARREKQEVSAPTTSQGDTDIHYGKRFAETEAILKARAEERAVADAERHEGAREADMHLGSTEEQVTPSPGPPATGAVASEAGMPGMGREPASGGGKRRRRHKAENERLKLLRRERPANGQQQYSDAVADKTYDQRRAA